MKVFFWRWHITERFCIPPLMEGEKPPVIIQLSWYKKLVLWCLILSFFYFLSQRNWFAVFLFIVLPFRIHSILLYAYHVFQKPKQ